MTKKQTQKKMCFLILQQTKLICNDENLIRDYLRLGGWMEPTVQEQEGTFWSNQNLYYDYNDSYTSHKLCRTQVIQYTGYIYMYTYIYVHIYIQLSNSL
jgi:hypothetical protein